MRYLITTATLMPAFEEEISKDRFDAVVEANRQIRLALSIEEKFNMLLDNYRTFELDLLEASLGSMVFAEFDWTWSQERIYTASRHLSNVLSMARSYIDSVHHNLDENIVHPLFALQYDDTLEYRVMESVRNYTQHQDIGVTRFQLPMERVENDGLVTVRHSIKLQLPTALLTELKANVRAELSAADINEIPVIPYVRIYISALARVHRSIRETVLPDMTPYETEIRAVLADAERLGHPSAPGLSVMELGDAGTPDQIEYLLPELIDRRTYLVRRTDRAQHIANHYVSGRVHD